MSQVGKDIDALCSKCKMLLTHVVVSEVDGVVSKVQCRTCGSLHKYREGGRSPGRTRTPRPAKSGSGARTAPQELQRLWQMKKEALPGDADVFDYRPDSEYEEGDVVRHTRFGLGFVERVVSRNRIEILFQNGLKLMAMNLDSVLIPGS